MPPLKSHDRPYETLSGMFMTLFPIPEVFYGFPAVMILRTEVLPRVFGLPIG